MAQYTMGNGEREYKMGMGKWSFLIRLLK